MWMESDESRLAEEAAWVRRAGQGDSDALSQLYERYIDQIYRYFYKRVESISEAEALTSEVFTRAVEALLRGKYQWQNKPFGFWLYGTAAKVLQERNSKLQKMPFIEDLDLVLEYYEPESEEGNALDSLIQKEERNALWQLVGELPLPEQQILVMRHVYDLPYVEIAKRLKRTQNASKQLHYRALNNLKRKIQASGLWSEAEEG